MGTNVYAEINACPHCGVPEEKLHVGKFSGGWVFALQVYPERGLNNLADWENFAYQNPKLTLIDEYGEIYSIFRLVDAIQNRKWSTVNIRGEKFHKQNNSQDAPNNLVRSKIDGVHCIGHEPMCDLMLGDFS